MVKLGTIDARSVDGAVTRGIYKYGKHYTNIKAKPAPTREYHLTGERK